MSKGEWKTVLIAVGAVVLLSNLNATRGLIGGGNRYWNR